MWASVHVLPSWTLARPAHSFSTDPDCSSAARPGRRTKVKAFHRTAVTSLVNSTTYAYFKYLSMCQNKQKEFHYLEMFLYTREFLQIKNHSPSSSQRTEDEAAQCKWAEKLHLLSTTSIKTMCLVLIYLEDYETYFQNYSFLLFFFCNFPWQIFTSISRNIFSKLFLYIVLH